MSPERNHEEIEGLLGAYTLGALDAEENDLIQAHLEGCSTCSATVSRLRKARDAMPLTVDTVAPPARLRQSILAAAGSSDRAGHAAVRSARIRPLRPSSRRGWQMPRGLAAPIAGAAVIAFALGAGLGLGVGRSLSTPPPAPVAAQYELTGTGQMAGANGHVYELQTLGLTLIEFSHLPVLQAGRIYELWLIPSGGNPIPAGVFMPDEGGSHVVVLARDLRGFAALAVTVERAPDGATAPTQQPQLAGNV